MPGARHRPARAPPPSSSARVLAGDDDDDDDDSISLWELLTACGVDVAAFFPGAGAAAQPQPEMPPPQVDDPTAAGEEAPKDGEVQHGGNNKPVHEPAGEVSMSTVLGLPVAVASKNTTDDAAKVLEVDPLQLTIGRPDALAISKPGSSTTSCKDTGSGIDLNMPAPEGIIVISDSDTDDDLLLPEKEARPLLGLIGRKDPPWQPIILESSLVAAEAAAAAAASAQREVEDNKRKRLHNNNVAAATASGIPNPTVSLPHMAAAGVQKDPVAAAAAATATEDKLRRPYVKFPANKIANLNAKINMLRQEELLQPHQRRSLAVIKEEINKLEAKKDEVHERMIFLLKRQEEENINTGEGSSNNE
ncbi:hypothetical protein ACP4OV_025977 [Aristida adscensionis]